MRVCAQNAARRDIERLLIFPMNAEKPLSFLWPNKLAWEIQTGLIKLWFNSCIHRLPRTAVSDSVLLISCRELFLGSRVQRMGRTGKGKEPPSPFSLICFQ